MSVGYAAYIEDGSITTGKEFLKRCIGAFCDTVKVGEKSLIIQTKFSPDAFYQQQYDVAAAKLAAVRAMTVDEARSEMRKRHEQNTAMAREFVEKYTAINERCAKIRKQVESWEPPTESHCRIKEFALEQIDAAMTSDKCLEKYGRQAFAVLDDSDKAVGAYIQEQIAFWEKSVQRAKDLLETEQNRVQRESDFMSQFINSLENM